MIALVVAVGGRWFPERPSGLTSGLLAMGALVLATSVICVLFERFTIRSEVARWLEQVFGSRLDEEQVDEHVAEEPEERS